MKEKTPSFDVLEAELLNARRQISALASELSAAREENERIARELDAVLHSRSWRMTAPLRRLMSVLRLRLEPARRSHGGNGTEQEVQDRGQEGVADSSEAGTVAKLPAFLLKEVATDLDSLNSPCSRLRLPDGLGLVVSDSPREPMAYPAEGKPAAIGFIGSEALYHDLAPDVPIHCVNENNWQIILTRERILFLLVETTWKPMHGCWRYPLVEDAADHNLIRALLEHCRKIGLPVVLWFRETPGNYGRFSWLCGLVDVTYVADPSLLESVRTEHPGARAEYLPPAIQPRVNNPLRPIDFLEASDALGDKILFDGWWDLHGDFPGLDALRKLKQYGLLVSESHWDFTNVRLDDLREFRNYTIGCLGREERLTLDRLVGAQVFARNPYAGEWHSSLMMCRAAACGSVVAWLDAGIAVPGDADRQVPDDDWVARLAAMLLDPLGRARHVHRVWRHLMRGHTVAHRLQKMVDDLDIPTDFLGPLPRIACLLVTMRPERLAGCLERFREDAYPAKELVVVVNDDGVDLNGLRRLVREEDHIRIYAAGKSQSLGACLNFAASQADAGFWTKMDDDDFYGRMYLSDVMLYQKLGDFKVFGKPPMFNYLESTDELMWDPVWARHQNLVHDAGRSRSALVAGGTIGGRLDVFDNLGFSVKRRGGSDSDFIRRCYEAGLDVLSMDGFNFVRYRSAKEKFHTWNISDRDIRERSFSVGSMSTMEHVAML